MTQNYLLKSLLKLFPHSSSGNGTPACIFILETLPTCANIRGCVTALCPLHLLSLGTMIPVWPEAVAETSALTFIYLFAKSV